MFADLVVTAVSRAREAAAHRRDRPFDGPIRLTREQAEQLCHEHGSPPPADWAAFMATRPTLLGMPLQLVAGPEDTTLWTYR